MLVVLALGFALQGPLWVTYEGKRGPGKGKHIVLLSGDEEYRSEEALPQFAKILAHRHGFSCTVLFSINAKGEIDPETQTNQPGLEALDKADLCIMLLRFRHWPDHQMRHFDRYYKSGKPIIALRTSTHAFSYPPESKSAFARYSWRSATWDGGFGRQVLGETWLSHWGNHGSQATLGIMEPGAERHPILRGVERTFGTTDVYEAHPPTDATILMRGRVLEGMTSEAPAAEGEKTTVNRRQRKLNAPMMPIAWTREPTHGTAVKGRVLTTTMGAATDLLDEGLRRLLVNGAYWALQMESRIPKAANVDLVGAYEPTPFGFQKYKRGVKPADHDEPAKGQ